MNIKYYSIFLDGSSKDGVLYAPSEIHYPFAVDGFPLPDMNGINFVLKDGCYADYMVANICNRFVSEQLMELFKSYLKPFQKVIFVPVQVKSEQYGNRIYYLMHFEEVYDVIDKENSKYVGEGEHRSLTVPCFDYLKIKGMDIFIWDNLSIGLVVSENVRKEMKKKKMTMGIELEQVACINKP